MNVKLDKAAILRGDPILYFLSRKLKVRPAYIGVMFAIFTVILIVWANITGVWSSQLDHHNTHFLRSSWHTWAGNFLLAWGNVFIILFYFKLPKLLEDIYATKVIGGDSRNFEEIYNSIFVGEKFKWLYVVIFCTSFELAWLLQSLWLQDNMIGWTEKETVGQMSSLGWYHIVLFVLQFSIAFSFLINTIKIIGLFRRLEMSISLGLLDYNVVRLCQYSAGGLKNLGDIILKVLGVFAIFGVYAALIFLSVIRKYPDIHWSAWQGAELSAIGIYVLLAFIILCLLLWPIHSFMKRKRDSLFKQITKYDLEVSILDDQEVGKDLNNREVIEKFKFNDEAFAIIHKIPIWPFNAKWALQILGTIGLPILLMVIDYLMKK